MSEPFPGVPPRRAPFPPAGRGPIRFLCNSNPFYAISAVLVLFGLRVSYDPDAGAFPTWALLAGLAGFATLLAGMACLLVRRWGVWDDVRTLLLLVAMVLLSVSAFFDDILARDASLGVACEVGGLLFAVALSEALIRGLALRLPIGFRAPYHLLLALFFLHPVALVPLLKHPDDPALMWGLFAFPALAGAVALSLLPAARRGPAYVAKNGSPWRWPLYPWSLFALMSVGVCVRSWSVCLAANYSGGTSGFEAIDATIFGPYFLVPFFFGVAAVVLESGIATGSRGARLAGLAMPALLVGLAAVGHRPDAPYRRFLGLVADAAGGSPMFLALVAAAGFYGLAARRRVPLAFDSLTFAIAAMAVVGPGALTLFDLSPPRAAPLLVAAMLQAGRAVARKSSGRALVASSALVAATAIGPIGSWGDPARAFAALHVAVASAMGIGALLDDALARALRALAAGALALLALAPLGAMIGLLAIDPPRGYPLVPIVAAGLYGGLAGGRPFFYAAGFGLAGWLAVSGASGYATLRRSVVGLDQIAWGLVSFGLAALISVAKAGALPGRALLRRRSRGPGRVR